MQIWPLICDHAGMVRTLAPIGGADYWRLLKERGKFSAQKLLGSTCTSVFTASDWLPGCRPKLETKECLQEVVKAGQHSTGNCLVPVLTWPLVVTGSDLRMRYGLEADPRSRVLGFARLLCQTRAHKRTNYKPLDSFTALLDRTSEASAGPAYGLRGAQLQLSSSSNCGIESGSRA